MTATQIRPAGRLSPLVAGIRTAVKSQVGWAETAQLVAVEPDGSFSIHVYGTDVSRVGSSARRYYD
jgi:hypothetical protein